MDVGCKPTESSFKDGVGLMAGGSAGDKFRLMLLNLNTLIHVERSNHMEVKEWEGNGGTK